MTDCAVTTCELKATDEPQEFAVDLRSNHEISTVVVYLCAVHSNFRVPDVRWLRRAEPCCRADVPCTCPKWCWHWQCPGHDTPTKGTT